jgi:hypothetical protein
LVNQKWKNNVDAAFIIRAMMMVEAASISETSVDIQLRTRQYIPEDSELYFIGSSDELYLLI